MAEAAFSQGNVAFVSDDFGEALKHFNNAIDQEDTNPLYYCARSAVHCKQGNYSEALADANSAVQLEPANKLGHVRKGQAYFALNDFKNSKDALRTAKKLGDVNSAKMLADCYAKLGTNPVEDDEADEKAAKASLSMEAADTTHNTAVSSGSPSVAASQNRIKHDFYQTADFVIVSIMIKKVDPANVKVEFGEASLSCDVKLHTGADYNLEIDTFYKIVPAESKYFVRSTKIEIKMKKKSHVQWPALEGEGLEASGGPGVQMAAAAAVSAKPIGYDQEKKWTKLAQDVTKEEKEEKLEGDAALNQLFQQIYGDADEDTRRAMNKSFQESGGTVLSTNWKDIGSKKTEIKPPDGMEHKKY